MTSRTPTVSAATFSRRFSSVTTSRNRARIGFLIHLACQSFLRGQATHVSGINVSIKQDASPISRYAASRSAPIDCDAPNSTIMSGTSVVSYRLE